MLEPVAVAVRRREHEELRVEALERLVQLLLLLDLDDELDALAQLDVLVARADDPRVAGRAAPRSRSAARVEARIASSASSASRASAPPASARWAAAASRTATISEMPSPSEMA